MNIKQEFSHPIDAIPTLPRMKESLREESADLWIPTVGGKKAIRNDEPAYEKCDKLPLTPAK
jgi:hypothetical protein